MSQENPEAERAQRAVDTIRFLAVDAVERAASGHPGMPMGMADAAFTLWTRFLRHDPTDPDWVDRDRFVLSAGHGSMLIYALLHLSGYELTIDDIKSFRQWESATPGHPERGDTPGVEVTTGPLGQGLGNAVGMALAAHRLAETFNGQGFDPVGQRVFGIVSDGDLMEGVASEAASIAGHLRLGRMTLLYDDNSITIEGETELTFAEDVGGRFEAYGWHVLHVDGHDREAVAEAIQAGIDETGRPSLICCRTRIAYGSPGKEGTAASHGSPLGEEEVEATKRARVWPSEPTFHVPDEVRELFAERAEALARERKAWNKGYEGWREEERRAGGLLGRAPRASGGRRRARAADRGGAARRRRHARPRRQGAPGGRRGGPRADRRLRRPRSVDEHRDPRGGLDRARRPRGPEPPLRHPRARHGRVDERPGRARLGAPVRRDVPRLRRLHAPVHPPRGADEAPGGLRLHARQHLRG
jgi:transketolase